jgi:aminomethyltransferase
MPLEYPSGTLAEHLACRRDAAVFDVSHLGTVRLEGPGGFERLQRELSNDLARVHPGRAQYTHMLDESGSVVDDIIVWWVSDDRFDVMPNASNTARVLGRLGGEDVTGQRAVLAVQGPGARRALQACFPEAAAVPRFAVHTMTWKGAPVVVAGTGYTGEDGVECAVPADVAAELWDSVVAAGAVPAGLGARDTLRLEAGLPLHGNELGPGLSPLEAGLGWVVAWDKPGGFTGLGALDSERRRGLRRRLVGLVGATRRPFRAGYGVRDGVGPQTGGGAGSGAAAGAGAGVGGTGWAEVPPAELPTLTSGNFSPVLGCGIGMAFLPSYVRHGSAARVVARGAEVPATVTRLPFLRKAPTATDGSSRG